MDAIRVFAGDCTITEDGEREQRGDVVVVIKPDDTVLIHDRDGYQPAAWLTRPETLSYEGTSGGTFSLTATDGESSLDVVANEEHGLARYPASDAGVPVGDCPDCEGALVRATGAVACLDCDERYGLPAGADVLDRTCRDCGLPTMIAERGRAFTLCIDRECESLDDRVNEAFDREWGCPDCDGDLRVIRNGQLLAGCENYPDCETAFSIPSGTVDGDCECGLPAFDTGGGRRCLDATCERAG
ncbi:endonuclease NucS domain-containing protein [Halococcus qingdaonensis]|uniref:endonuclease NucS domain-containing protein n=1 Tax=Halococcus qingdaonensis TaxID=224402 RepID=UPI002116D9FB|nr:endonuclease NucS domain-containing protein [Halococcus qingdaonensis]